MLFPIVLNVQTVFVQQEVIDAHNQHAGLIVIRRRRIFGNNHSLEEISGQHQRTLFLLQLRLIRNRVSGLDIIALGTLVAEKINLQLFADAVAFIIGAVLHNKTIPAYQCISFTSYRIALSIRKESQR